MDSSALGRYLRESREAKELTLEDAVSALRIRRPILEAFEQGDFSLVETPVQMRGLLRNYARFLDLEEERVLQYYEAAMKPKRRRRFGRRKKRDSQLRAPHRITDTPPALPPVEESITYPDRERAARRDNNLLRNVFMFMGTLAALALIIYVVADTVEFGSQESLDGVSPIALAESVTAMSQDTTPSATFIPTSTPFEPTSASLGFAAQGFVGLSVRMEITQRAWVRIVADDVEQLAEILEPDEIVELEANDSVQIITANALAVRLTVNDVVQPTFGQRGQQAEVNITTSGISITLEGEPSATPSYTPLPPTNTPVPLPTIDLPTSTPTAVQVNLIGQKSDNSTSITREPTVALPTPTSIFDEPAPLPTDEPITASRPADESSADNQAAAVADTTNQSESAPQSNDGEVEATATDLPPTASGAVLPVRATPANPTPTKSG